MIGVIGLTLFTSLGYWLRGAEKAPSLLTAVAAKAGAPLSVGQAVVADDSGEEAEDDDSALLNPGATPAAKGTPAKGPTPKPEPNPFRPYRGSAPRAALRAVTPSPFTSPIPGEKDMTKKEVSLTRMAMALASFSSPKLQQPMTLVKDLDKAGLKPVVSQDFNEDTGKMLIMRTNEVMEGTRYFHAQYFEDENKKPFLQHMSFEVQPAPDAMDNATRAIEKAFGDLGKPDTEKSDYRKWKTDNGYVVWIKKMGKEDLKGDPYNAYTKDDVGTIRVAVEEDPHAHGDDDEHTPSHDDED